MNDKSRNSLSLDPVPGKLSSLFLGSVISGTETPEKEHKKDGVIVSLPLPDPFYQLNNRA